MDDYKVRIGRYGENLAAQFLVRNGAKIIDRNFYTRFGEIDLIARSGDEILFVEVKTRTSNDFGYPEDAVDWRKIRHLIKAINIYMASKGLDNMFWRLDAISVEINAISKVAKIKWFKNLTND